MDYSRIKYYRKRLFGAPRGFSRDVLRRLTLWRDLKRKDGRSAMPRTVAFHLTDNCNARCTMCWMYGEHGVFLDPNARRPELPLETAFRVIDQVAAFRPNLYFTGGEPLVYKGIVEVVEYASKRGLACEINTNGISLPKMADPLVEAGLAILTVSLLGPPECHDRVARVAHSFERATQGIQEVQRAKRVRRSRKPVIRINCAITSENYRQLRDMAEIASSLQADKITFLHLRYTPENIVDAHSDFFERHFGVPSDYFRGDNRDGGGIDPHYLLEEMRDLRRNSPKNLLIGYFPDVDYSEIVPYYTDSSHRFKRAGCFYPWLTARVLPTGEVVGCLIDDWVIGNVKEYDLTLLWNHERFQKFRKVLQECGLFPGCNRCCNRLY